MNCYHSSLPALGHAVWVESEVEMKIASLWLCRYDPVARLGLVYYFLCLVPHLCVEE